MMNEDELRQKVWNMYHDIQLLEDMGFVPVGFPPLNPEDVPDTMQGLRNADDYNSSISLMRFGPRESVLTARPCNGDVTIRLDGEEYTMPRACLHCPDSVDKCIEGWLAENIGVTE